LAAREPRKGGGRLLGGEQRELTKREKLLSQPENNASFGGSCGSKRTYYLRLGGKPAQGGVYRLVSRKTLKSDLKSEDEKECDANPIESAKMKQRKREIDSREV